jgi:RNA polymerase sigma factor (sigma-70 family)
MTTPNEPLLRYLRRLTSPSDHLASDATLLERFRSQGDETAFAALLARHGPMVHGVCHRILRDIHDAEDAFQATFLVLAGKARSLRRSEALATWLYGIARRLASTTLRAGCRRRQREARCSQPAIGSSQGDLLDDLSARELLLALDEEMARLPERYRLPLILCYLERRTHEEAARVLGWTAGSVKGRLERGRKKLHERLSRRGLELSGALLAWAASHGAAIVSVAVDPQGKRLALAHFDDGKIILCELATGKELATCPGHRGGTRVVVFSPDGKWLASAGKDKQIGGKDNRIRVWDAATLREVRSWQMDCDAVYQLQFTPDGKGLASVVSSGAKECEFRFWEAATGEERPQ